MYRDRATISGLKLKNYSNLLKRTQRNIVPFHSEYLKQELIPCQFCFRQFLGPVFDRHKLICKSVFLGRRQLFSSQKQRGVQIPEGRSIKIRSKINANWREKDQRLKQFIKI